MACPVVEMPNAGRRLSHSFSDPMFELMPPMCIDSRESPPRCQDLPGTCIRHRKTIRRVAKIMLASKHPKTKFSLREYNLSGDFMH